MSLDEYKSPLAKPLHKPTLVMGIIAVASFFFVYTVGIPSIVCGIIGMVMANKVKNTHKTTIGSILSLIGLLMGLGLVVAMITLGIIVAGSTPGYVEG